MPPKQTKKQTTDVEKPIETDSNEMIKSIKKEWSVIVKDIVSTRDKLAQLENRNQEIITKLWEIMNKNPSEQVIVEATNTEEEKKPVKSKKVEKAESETEESEIKPKAKASAKKTKAEPKAETKPEIEKPNDEKPTPATKKITKKDTKETKETKEIKETKEVKKVPATGTAASKGKISAPSKGTPKPKQVDSDDEKPKPTLDEDSSSDTEVDSLSSVSSESDGSGGEDD